MGEPKPKDLASLVEMLEAKRPEARKRMLLWSCLFVAVFSVMLLIVSIDDLRTFDAVLLPGVFLLTIISLALGFYIGHTRTLASVAKAGQRAQKQP